MKKRILRLNLKGVHFHDVKNGDKLDEYRLANEFWSKKLLYQEYDEVWVMLGYPKNGDVERHLYFKWDGCKIIKDFQHDEFGPRKQIVFAVSLRKKIL